MPGPSAGVRPSAKADPRVASFFKSRCLADRDRRRPHLCKTVLRPFWCSIGWLACSSPCDEPWDCLPPRLSLHSLLFGAQSTRISLSSEVRQGCARVTQIINADITWNFPEGDRVVIHGKSPLLTKPLTKGGRTEARRGVLEHDNIIGKRVWDPVKAYKGRLREPS